MSSYPQVTTEQAKAFSRTLLVREDLTQSDVDDFLRANDIDGGDVDYDGIIDIVEQLDAQLAATKSNDGRLEDLEAQFATPVFEALRVLPMEALGDAKFWSYLAVRFFWGFIQRRQRSSLPFAKPARVVAGDEGNEGSERLPVARYVIGKDHYQIPLRMFLRAQAVDGSDGFISRNPIPDGTDFWRSHVLGVRTSAYPTWARAVVAAQSREGLDIRGQRVSAKRVNRIRANVSMALHSDAEAIAIVASLWRAD